MDIFYKTINILLSRSNISYNSKSLKLELLSHPDFPYLNAVIDTLSALKIKSVVTRISIDNLVKNGAPALIHLNDRKNKLVILDYICNDYIVIYDAHTNKKEKYTINHLREAWDGIVLYIIEDKSQNQNFFEKISYWTNKYLHALLISFILLLTTIIFGFSSEKNWFYLISLLLKFTGVVACIGLTMHKLKKTTNALEKFCSFTKSTSCSAVLHSKASKIGGIISLSDIGMVYFCGGILILITGLLGSQSQECLKALFYLSWLSIPYAIFSLYYQNFIVKKWCPLCLSVLVLFFLEVFTSVFYFSQVDNAFISWKMMLFVFLIFGLTIILWNILFGFLLTEQKYEQLAINYLKIKKNTNLFKELLDKSRPIHIADNPVLNVQTSATMHIVAVISPHCSSCANTYMDLVGIKSALGDELNLSIIFPLNSSEKLHEQNQISVYFYAIYIKEGWDRLVEALNVWLTNTDFSSLKIKYPIIFDYNEVYSILREQSQWLEKEQLTSTPTILINGKIMPSIYQVKDLQFIIQNME